MTKRAAKKNDKFAIPDPKPQADKAIDAKAKYELGQRGYYFHEIRDLKPVFAFDYLSLNKSKLCFDCETLEERDFIGFLKALKTISLKTYKELKETRNYRFHAVDFNDKRVAISRKQFKKALTFKEDLLSDDELPTLYQFDLHYKIEARAAGFLYKGVFYLVWFDCNHNIYPHKN